MSGKNMEKCQTTVESIVEASCRTMIDRPPILPDQVGTTDFTRLRDIPTNGETTSIVRIDAQGHVNGDVLASPFDAVSTQSCVFISADTLWSGVPIPGTATFTLVGPLDETFIGNLLIIKPQITD